MDIKSFFADPPFHMLFYGSFGAPAHGVYTTAGVWGKRGWRVDESTVFRSAQSLPEATRSREISLDILNIFALELKSGLGTVAPAEVILACCW